MVPPKSEERVVSDHSRLKVALCAVAIILGLIQAMAGESFAGDGISYLDMGDALFSGNWKGILNELWSPLYPALLGLTRWLMQPTMRWEPPVIQLANFLIYVMTVLSFQFYWAELLALYRGATEKGFATFTDKQFWILGYTIFLFMHLNFVTNTSPDMLLAAIVYVSAGLILRIHRNGPTLGKYCLLGLLLGLGFLTKAMMLPLSAFFIACSVWPIRPWRTAMLYTLGTVLIFGAVAGPYIAELSKVKGHFTAGEAGYLNYVWHIDGLPFVHWQGAPSEFGTPLHPTRQIYASPLVYEFATKPGETYPPWDDPGYWMQGVRARFNWTEQLVATGKSLRNYRTALWSQTVLIVGVLVLLAMRQSWRSTIREFLAKWYVWLPALAAFAAYALIWVEGRYLPQFFVSVWAAMLILVKLPEGNDSQRLIRVVPLVVASLLGIRIASDFVGNIAEGYREVKLEMQIAEGLSAKKVTPGDRIAVVDAVLGEDWQKLLRLSIVAEIPSDEQNKFWSTSEAERLGIYQSLRTTGAKVLVAAHVPEWADTTGWKQIGTSPAYVLRLSQ